MALLKKLLLWTGAIVVSSVEPSCDIFLAPSKIQGGGYGVFAARDFPKSVVVEMSPLFLPMDAKSPVLMHTVLDDYHYGYTRDHSDESLGVMALGMVMFYNHDKEPNLLWITNIGRGEPSASDADAVGSAVFVARRNITKGEELFSSYGLEDEGASWFSARRIEMADNIAESKIPPEELDNYRRDYCSKMFAGIGSSTYNSRIKREKDIYTLQTTTLPVDDAPNAVAKVSIRAGDRIEIAPALVLSRELIKGSAVVPLGFNWEDLDEQQHDALKELRQAGKLKLQHQDPETMWRRVDRFERFEDIVVFPAAGNTGMVKRVGSDDPNCAMEIKSSGPDSEGAGLVLEIVALKDIQAGNTLRLNIAPTGSDEEKFALIEILETTGQPLSEDLQSFKVANSKPGEEL